MSRLRWPNSRHSLSDVPGTVHAVTESFFATLKTELIHRQPWPTRRVATDAVVDYIEGFYNPYRLHSALGYISPNEFERRHVRTVTCAA